MEKLVISNAVNPRARHRPQRPSARKLDEGRQRQIRVARGVLEKHGEAALEGGGEGAQERIVPWQLEEEGVALVQQSKDGKSIRPGEAPCLPPA